ncbi:MAG: hypothetical protein CMJ72_08975 [Planctomycetaceae bacterium]|nr:hypothetical protein [Planctomycetaceae bacterium]MCH2596727.1 bile acid:sodium symporter [Pirellulales bacterium]
MLQFWIRHWFLLSLTAILVIGIGWSSSLASLAAEIPREWVIASVLLAMALPLRLDLQSNTLRYPLPVLLAVTVNWLFIPGLALLASKLLIPDLALGLIIAAAVPCTLASAAVWTRLAGGNDAVSLLVTIVTNLGCFLVTPALIQVCAGYSDVKISFGEMAHKLLVLIVLPLVLAQLLRRIASVGQCADKNKPLLTIYAQCGILVIVFIGAIYSGEKLVDQSSLGWQFTIMIALVAVIHVFAWLCGFWLAGWFGIGREEQIAVAFAGSQKTLMVGLAIALHFGGLVILPMLTYHVAQLLIDTLLAGRLQSQFHD